MRCDTLSGDTHSHIQRIASCTEHHSSKIVPYGSAVHAHTHTRTHKHITILNHIKVNIRLKNVQIIDRQLLEFAWQLLSSTLFLYIKLIFAMTSVREMFRSVEGDNGYRHP